jgi:hypothetical protein
LDSRPWLEIHWAERKDEIKRKGVGESHKTSRVRDDDFSNGCRSYIQVHYLVLGCKVMKNAFVACKREGKREAVWASLKSTRPKHRAELELDGRQRQTGGVETCIITLDCTKEVGSPWESRTRDVTRLESESVWWARASPYND